MIIGPTQTCFDDVLDHQDLVHRADPAKAVRQFIVHGILLFPEGRDAGEPFAHAWVYDPLDDTVYQSGMLNGEKIWWGVARAEFTRLMRPQTSTVYTFAEALALNFTFGTFGPWEPRYQALTGRGQAANDDPQ